MSEENLIDGNLKMGILDAFIYLFFPDNQQTIIWFGWHHIGDSEKINLKIIILKH